MRKYEAIWSRLKQHKIVVLEVNPKFFSRVKKAVIKEKDKDTGFKILNEDDPVRLCISWDLEAKKMVCRLVQRLGLEEIKV